VNVENPPNISGISTSTATSTAAISWTTNEAATSQVNYGLTSAYGSSTATSTLVTSHSITLTGLTQNTTYHYEIQSTDTQASTATTTDGTFTTAFVPVISIVQSTSTSFAGLGATSSLAFSSPTQPAISYSYMARLEGARPQRLPSPTAKATLTPIPLLSSMDVGIAQALSAMHPTSKREVIGSQ
jgi:hypothetical protein